jgi:hypothetical protein
MKDVRQWAWLLLFGSVWGISEVAVGGALYRANVAHASVWLAAWAFLILAVARGVLNKPGSSAAIGALAAMFKLVNAGPFLCHLLGIFALGVAFDLVATLLIGDERTVSYRTAAAGLASAYGGYALFALTITYGIRYSYWIAGGLPKVLNHILVGGSFAALTAVVAVPLGYWLGLRGEALALRRPRWAYSGALLASVVFWSLGRIAG